MAETQPEVLNAVKAETVTPYVPFLISDAGYYGFVDSAGVLYYGPWSESEALAKSQICRANQEPLE